MSKTVTGAQIMWEALVAEGVDVCFGMPGGAILPFYDAHAKYEYPVHHVLVTHEQRLANRCQRSIQLEGGEIVADKRNTPSVVASASGQN